MAAAAVMTREFQRVRPNEEFGRSLHGVGDLGRLMTQQTVELDLNVPDERARVEEEVRQDFFTRVTENVVTMRQQKTEQGAKELSERLKFEPMRKFRKIDGHVVSSTGQPVTEMVMEGFLAAQEKAQKDPRFASEEERGWGDVLVSQKVDDMPVGHVLAFASMEPVEAIEKDGEEFWRGVSVIGYEKGLAVIQVYYREDENTVWAGAFSVKNSDKAAFLKLLEVNGVQGVSANITANQMIRHGIQKKMSHAEAMNFGQQLHSQYQRIIGRQDNSISVTKIVEQQRSAVEGYFNTYIKHGLAEAYYTGRNNKVMQGLALALLNAGADTFAPEDRRAMIRVANAASFTREDAQFMENAICYAASQEIWRTLLQAYNHNAGATLDGATFAALPYRHDSSEDMARMHERAAANVRHGVVHGSIGLGCAPSRFGQRVDGETKTDADDYGQQDVFGGQGRTATAEQASGASGEVCEYENPNCYCYGLTKNGEPDDAPELPIASSRPGKVECLRDGCGAYMLLDKEGNPTKIEKGEIYRLSQTRNPATTPESE